MGETSGCSANSLKSKVVPAWCNPRTNNPSVLWNTAIVAEVVSFLERPSVENESPVAASVLSRLSEGLECARALVVMQRNTTKSAFDKLRRAQE